MEILLTLYEDIADLTCGNVYTHFVQLLQQQRLCHMAMVVLIEDKTNQVGRKMFTTQLGWRLRRNIATIRCLPTFQKVSDIVGLEYKTLNSEILVALKGRPFGNVLGRQQFPLVNEETAHPLAGG